MKEKELVKVKTVIASWSWGNEIVNSWAYVSDNHDGTYQVHYDDGETYDNFMTFNLSDRAFHFS